MRFHTQLALLIFLIPLVLATEEAVLAMETDQFTTPPAPLYDIGPALSRKIVAVIESDRTSSDPERVLSEWIGSNIFASRVVRWVKHIRVGDSQVRFLPNVFDSIYGPVFSLVPATFLFDSPTVNVHGFYVGTDKIDHFFQQGHQYYEQVMQKRAEGADDSAASAAAVAHGAKQEHWYYGTFVSGVYSNGDLAANYAGMKFFLNLRQPVRIGENVWPPLLEPGPQGWSLRSEVDRDHLLQRFFSDHLNESMNPSRYRFGRGWIRSRVHDRCQGWMDFYADRLDLVARAGRSFATTWFGEAYGHWLPPADEVSIATECPLPDQPLQGP